MEVAMASPQLLSVRAEEVLKVAPFSSARGLRKLEVVSPTEPGELVYPSHLDIALMSLKESSGVLRVIGYPMGRLGSPRRSTG
jgi:hypothetical protein